MGFFEKASSEGRDFDRLRCSQDFELHVLDRGVLMASLMDISRSGCRIMVDGGVGEGDFVMLEFTRDSAVDATVVWSRGSVAGCRFVKPVSRMTVRVIIDRCRGYGSPAYGHGDPDAPRWTHARG